MIAHLRHDHDRIRDLADRLDAYLCHETPPNDPEFSQVRWMLVRELSMHLAMERPALTAWQARSKLVADAMDVGLDDAFAQHVATWSGANMSTTWDKYCAATRTLLTRLRRRMSFEETSIFPSIAAQRGA